jgi:hypothetical protein
MDSLMSSTINAITTGVGGVVTTADNSGILKLQTTGVDALTIDASQNVGIGTASPTQKLDVTGNINTSGSLNSINTFGFKNRIINGGMVIDQRNAGASVTLPVTGSQYTLDRWTCASVNASKYSVQQNAGAVNPPAGFTNYLGVTSLAATTVASGEYYFLLQAIEGYNVADLDFGTANANTVTLSFWVRSSLTGTFGGALQAQASTRTYPFGYSIPVANTWTKISVTVAGDTSGTWFKTNGVGIQVFFGLGIGATYSGTTGSWSTTNFISVTGATSVVGTSGATFYITGVQLEKGSIATSFDYRPYGTELALCQRYYNRWSGANSPNIGLATALLTGSTAPSARRATWANPVDFRSQPTMGSGGTIQFYTAGLTNLQFSSFNGTQSNKNIISIDINSSSAGTIGQSGMLIIDSTSAANFIDASAEL